MGRVIVPSVVGDGRFGILLLEEAELLAALCVYCESEVVFERDIEEIRTFSCSSNSCNSRFLFEVGYYSGLVFPVEISTRISLTSKKKHVEEFLNYWFQSKDAEVTYE